MKRRKNTIQIHDPHLQSFAVVLRRAINQYGDLSEEDVTSRQRRQVETLVALETHFRDSLVRHAAGPKVYRQFLEFITKTKRNILDARPYFRERQSLFMAKISPAMKAGDPEALYPYAINFQFVKFVMGCRTWRTTGPAAAIDAQIVETARLIEAQRLALVELNMPLALSRANIFWKATRALSKMMSSEMLPGGSHLDYMDLVQIASEGLMAGVDKFVLPYTPVFRSVCIGRMVGDFIEAHSETLLHFYPQDRRKIYRARKLMGRNGTLDTDEAVAEINQGVDPRHHTDRAEVSHLMAAVACESADVEVDDPSGEGDFTHTRLDTFAGDAELQPDVQAEELEARTKVGSAIGYLSLFDRKFLRLKGVAFAETL